MHHSIDRASLRNRVAFGIALSALLAAPIAASAAPQLSLLPGFDNSKPQENWTQTYFNAAHTGFNPKESTISVRNVGSLQLLWGEALGGGVTGYALDKGTIFAQGSNASGPPILSAIRASNGHSLWSISTGDDGYPSNGTVATGPGSVFSGCGIVDGGNAGGVCAFSQATGHLRWHYIPDCQCQFNGTLAAPLVYAKGVVYYGASGFPGLSDPYIVALNATTGTVIWSYDPGSGALGNAPLAVSGGLVYFDCVTTGNSQGICAVAQSSGSFVWHFPTSSASTAFAVEGGVLYASTDQSTVIALNATNGAQMWSSSTAVGRTNESPAIAHGVVYVAGNSSLSALKASNGKVLWSSPLACSPQSSPSIANGVVYVDQGGNNCPALSAFNANTGATLASISTSTASVNTPPVIANGTLYVNDDACGSICAYKVAHL